MKQMSTKSGGLFTAVLLTAFCLSAPFTASAQDKAKPATPAAAEATKEKKPRLYPFNGKVSAVDKKAKTITLLGKEKSRVLHLDATAKIQKMGKPATLEDVTIGEDVGGQVSKTDDGRELIVSLRIGAKPEAEKKPETEKKPKQEKPATDK